MEENKITLAGEIYEKPEFSHECFGERFYKFKIATKRFSDYTDIVPCIIPEILLDKIKDERVLVSGEIRTITRENHLIVFIFVNDVEYGTPAFNQNDIQIKCYICKPVTYRTTPLGRKIAETIVAVNGRCNKSYYIPIIAWGRNAARLAVQTVGTKIEVSGRFQSREYTKQLGDETVEKTAYEVSIGKMVVCE